MASNIKKLRKAVEKRGDFMSPLLPANWVTLKGDFTVEELETIINAVRDNYKKINGNS